ncbi:hypothetical protein KEM56_001753 [Ascosphaera pollenicola]|nr:hypothetical protein KEM56_001753 [Ascosphaera pollenicola]
MRIDANLMTALAAGLIAPADAFWRLPCRGRSGVARIDPIVDPGKPAAHVHSLHGSGALSFTSDHDSLQAANCTSCAVKEDKSAYWTPSLYFQHSNGSSEIVEQVGGMLAYYLLYGENITAFPKNFRMLAGDQHQRNFTLPFPDPPQSLWTGIQTTQFSLMQKAIGFNCLNYDTTPEASLYRHVMPEKSFMDEQCKDGLRLEMAFPSCWNGKDLDSSNHRDHVRYPSLVRDGDCPAGFEHRLVSLFYETIWNTYAFKGVEGRFVLANGDPTGCGYHADFMEGWDDGVLQKAIDTCTNLSGLVEDCSIFSLQTQDEERQCLVDIPDAIKDEDAFFAEDGLPGGVPIYDGPGYAGMATTSSKPSSHAASPSVSPSSAASPSPSSASAASASSPSAANFAPQPATGTSQASASASPAASSQAAQVPGQDSQTPPAEGTPATTNAPVAPAQGDDGVKVRTTTYTSGRQVFEVVIKEEDVTKTTTVDANATPAPAKRDHVEAHMKRTHGRH